MTSWTLKQKFGRLTSVASVVHSARSHARLLLGGGSPSRAERGAQPAGSNVRGACVASDHRVTFRFKAPQARQVQLRPGGDEQRPGPRPLNRASISFALAQAAPRNESMTHCRRSAKSCSKPAFDTCSSSRPERRMNGRPGATRCMISSHGHSRSSGLMAHHSSSELHAAASPIVQRPRRDRRDRRPAKHKSARIRLPGMELNSGGSLLARVLQIRDRSNT